MIPIENALKAVSQTDAELRVGNYLVLFGGKDLEGDHFTKSTKFDSAYTDTGALYVDFEHGRDHEKTGNTPDHVVGLVDWKSAKADDVGIFVERVLNRRAAYMKGLTQLLEAGLLGTSSAAIPRNVRKASDGEILAWPLLRDSLTVTPMEPRMATANVLTAAKSLAAFFPASESLALLIEDDTPAKAIARTIKAGGMPSLSDFEDFLRESGFSKSQAVTVASRGLGHLLSRSESASEPAPEGKALADLLTSFELPRI